MKETSLRLLYLSFNMPWRGGGTFYRAFGLAQTLAARGHQVTLMATALEERWRLRVETVEGVQLVLSPSWLTGRLRTGWDPYDIVQRRRWLRGRRFDLIHGFESRPVVIHPALYSLGQSQARLVLDWCDWLGRGGLVEERDRLTQCILGPVETFYEEHFRRRAHGTTVINETLRQRATGLGIAPASIHWLPNGVDTRRIQALNRLEARQMLGLPLDEFLVGYLGQAFPSDAAYLAEVFGRLQAARPMARLLLIGHHKTDWRRYFPDPAAIYETGALDHNQLNRYLAAGDLMWLPLTNTQANRGRWPMKLNDYMASGRATVATDVGDWRTLFQGERPIGRLSSTEPADFVRQTLALLDNDGARQACERHARHLAETQFDWEVVTTQLEAYYREVLAQPVRPARSY